MKRSREEKSESPPTDKHSSVLADNYTTEKEAAKFLGVSPEWLQRSRWSGEYPDLTYMKLGNAVRYRISVLEAFAQKNTISHSSQSKK